MSLLTTRASFFAIMLNTFTCASAARRKLVKAHVTTGSARRVQRDLSLCKQFHLFRAVTSRK